jgi:hypothetical protein
MKDVLKLKKPKPLKKAKKCVGMKPLKIKLKI